MNMYKILHLFRVSNFTEDFIKFVNNNFIENTHEFWIYGDREASNPRIDISLYRNVRYIHCIEEKLKSKELYTYDKIIYHGAFEQTIINVFFLKRRLLNSANNSFPTLITLSAYSLSPYDRGAKILIFSSLNLNFHEFINFEEEKAITNEKNMTQLSQLESIKETWNVIFNERLD